MTRYTLPLALLGLLLLTPSCRHTHVSGGHHYSHEEATPVSELDTHEFSRTAPQHGRR